MNYENIHEFLDNYGRDNVIFCYGNYAVAGMVKNLITSAGLVGMPVVFFALDKKAARELELMCDVVNYFDKGVTPDKFYEFGTEEYKKVVWQCWLIGNEILKSGRSYIYVDVDVVVRKNFEKDMLHKDIDCLIQFNGKNCCTGFYSLQPTKRTVDLFTMDFLEQNKYMDYRHDQAFFNALIYECSILTIKFLDADEYPNGKHYYQEHKRINDVCKIVHFNGIIGYETKVNKMKEHGLWMLR